MIRQIFVILSCILVLLCIMPVLAHVPIMAEDNNQFATAFVIDNPEKSQVIYGQFHENNDVAYYRLDMNSGGRLDLALMTNGYEGVVSDLIVMSPGVQDTAENSSRTIPVPDGYSAKVIHGQKPQKAEYEPFAPGAIFQTASYSSEITTPGTYYVTVNSPVAGAKYSLVVGYKEEFTPTEWVLVPVNVINTHVWEGQTVISLFAPFLAVVILGIILIGRREQRKKTTRPASFWIITTAGLVYLGGAALTLTQMFYALGITGYSGSVMLTLIFALIPTLLGTWMLRIARSGASRTIANRLLLAAIGGLGLVFWCGLIVGPVLAFVAAAIPEEKQ